MRLFTVIALLTIFLFVIVIACGRGQKQNFNGLETNNSSKNPIPEIPLDPNAPERNVLIVRAPDTAGMKAGDEFDVVVAYKFCEDVYQGSGRLLYDSSAVEPVRASKGSGIPKDAVFMCRIHENDIVPFAFTSLERQRGVGTGEGSLITVRFRAKKEIINGIRFRLQNGPEFLQLRDDKGKRFSFDLSSEVTPR